MTYSPLSHLFIMILVTYHNMYNLPHKKVTSPMGNKIIFTLHKCSLCKAVRFIFSSYR